MLLARMYVYLDAGWLPDETEMSDTQNVLSDCLPPALPLSHALLLCRPLLCKHLRAQVEMAT